MNIEKEIERNEKVKDVIRQEQFWFTATTLGFTGFIGALIRKPTIPEGCICLILITAVMSFTIYLLIGRYKNYCELNAKIYRLIERYKNHCELNATKYSTDFNSPPKVPENRWEALVQSIGELSGTLYCIGLVFLSWIGFFVIVINRLSQT